MTYLTQVKKNLSNLKLITQRTATPFLIIFLICSCTISPRQRESQNQINKVINLCKLIQEKPQLQSLNIQLKYSETWVQLIDKSYNQLTNIKATYQKEWEDFKNKSRSKIGGDCEKEINDNMKYYQETLKPAIELEKLRREKVNLEEHKKATEEKQKEIKFIKEILTSNNINTMKNDGLEGAISDLYSGKDSEQSLKKAIIFLRPVLYTFTGTLRVKTINKNYAFYANNSSIIAIKKLNHRSYLINSSPQGQYYRFIGTKDFKEINGNNRLMTFVEVWPLSEGADHRLVYSAVTDLK